MSSVQFKGVKQVCDAFDTMDCGEVWAIFEGRYLRFKGAGKQKLEQVLKKLKGTAYNSTYTLKVYEELKDTEVRKIKSNTEPDGSFNFLLYSDIEGSEDYSPYDQKRNDLRSEITMLREELKAFKEEQNRLDMEEQEEPEQSRLGIIGEIMESPLGPIVGDIIRNWAAPAMAGRQTMGAVGNIPPGQAQQPGTTATIGDAAGDINDPLALITEFKKFDPSIIKHLNILLRLAREDYKSFAFLIKQIDSM